MLGGFFKVIFRAIAAVAAFVFASFTRLVIVAVISLTAGTSLYSYFSNAGRQDLVLVPFGVPDALEKQGWTGETVAARLKTAITRITDPDPANAQVADRVLSFSGAERPESCVVGSLWGSKQRPAGQSSPLDTLGQEEDPIEVDVEIPGTGLNLSQLLGLVQQFVGPGKIVVSGDLTEVASENAGSGSPADGTILTTLRVTGMGSTKVIRIAGRLADLESSLETSAEQLVQFLDPMVLALFNIRDCKLVSAYRIVQACLRQDSRMCDGPARNRARVLYGLILAESGRREEAAFALRLALQSPLDSDFASKARTHLAYLNYRAFDMEQALEEIRRAHLVQPSDNFLSEFYVHVLRGELRFADATRFAKGRLLERIRGFLARPESGLPELGSYVAAVGELRSALLDSGNTVKDLDDIVSRMPLDPPEGGIFDVISDGSNTLGTVADSLNELDRSIAIFRDTAALQVAARGGKLAGGARACLTWRSQKRVTAELALYCALQFHYFRGFDHAGYAFAEPFKLQAGVLLKLGRVRELDSETDQHAWLSARILMLAMLREDNPRLGIDGGDPLQELHEWAVRRTWSEAMPELPMANAELLWFIAMKAIRRGLANRDQRDWEIALTHLYTLRELPAAIADPIWGERAGTAILLLKPLRGEPCNSTEQPTAEDLNRIFSISRRSATYYQGLLQDCAGNVGEAEASVLAASEMPEESPHDWAGPDEVLKDRLNAVVDSDQYAVVLGQAVARITSFEQPWFEADAESMSLAAARIYERRQDWRSVVGLADGYYEKAELRATGVNALIMLGRHHDAAEMGVSLIRNQGLDGPLLVLLGRSQARLGRWNEARESLEVAEFWFESHVLGAWNAIPAYAGARHAAFEMGTVLAEERLDDQALRFFRASYRDGEGQDEAYEAMMRLFCASGRPEEAESIREAVMFMSKIEGEEARAACGWINTAGGAR